MSVTQLVARQLENLANRAVQECPGLVAGTVLDGTTLPTAAGRRPGEEPKVSFTLATTCGKLLDGEILSAELLGRTNDQAPTAVRMDMKSRQCTVMAAAVRNGDGSSALHLSGSTLASPTFSYFGGTAIAAYMLANHASYRDFVSALGEAIDANGAGDPDALRPAVAKLSDEMLLAIERMLGGTDPTGIKQVFFGRDEQRGFDQSFAGGDLIPGACVDKVALDAFITSGARPVTFATAVLGEEPLATSFVGALPLKVRDCVKRLKHLLLTGPTATGKTVCVKEVLNAMGVPWVAMEGYEGLEDRDMIGAVQVRGGDTVFADGPLVQALRMGRMQYEAHLAESEFAASEAREPNWVPPAVLVADEVNRLQSRHMSLILDVMNVEPGTKEHVFRIPDTNEEITCPEGFFVIVAARNVGINYITNAMDHAFVRRFHKKIRVGYLEPEQEIELVMGRTGLSEPAAKMLVKVANDSRTQIAQLKAPIDTDTLLKWAHELAHAQKQGVGITEPIVMDLARDIVFEVVLEDNEHGEFDPAGEAVLTDNISEAFREVYGP